jgi:hypothetical protein
MPESRAKPEILGGRNGVMRRRHVHEFGKSMGTDLALPSYVRLPGKSAMTVPALILASLLALVALPVVSQITAGPGNQARPTGIHGSKDTGSRSGDQDDGSSKRS